MEKPKVFSILKMKRKEKWSELEDHKLLQLTKIHNASNWKKISDGIPGKTSIQCSARYSRIKPGLQKGNWSQEDDECLRYLNLMFGKNWSEISKWMPFRSSKQIRDRYINILDYENNKHKFTPDEDDLLMNSYLELGTNWNQIASMLKGRSWNMVKNRFFACLRKKIHGEQFPLLKKKRVKVIIDDNCVNEDSESGNSLNESNAGNYSSAYNTENLGCMEVNDPTRPFNFQNNPEFIESLICSYRNIPFKEYNGLRSSKETFQPFSNFTRANQISHSTQTSGPTITKGNTKTKEEDEQISETTHTRETYQEIDPNQNPQSSTQVMNFLNNNRNESTKNSLMRIIGLFSEEEKLVLYSLLHDMLHPSN